MRSRMPDSPTELELKVNIKPFVAQGLLFGVLFTIPLLLYYLAIGRYFFGPSILLATFIGSAFVFGLSMYIFTVWQSGNFRKTKQELSQNSIIGFDSAAGHLIGLEKVGGWLFLTDQYLYFKSHKANFRPHECTIPVSMIKKVSKTNTFVVIPDGLKIELKNGQSECFTIYGRKHLIKALNKAMCNGEEVL